MSVQLIVGLALISWLVFGVFGVWVACEKGRNELEGLFLGLFFGPFGVLIEALLPTVQRPTPRVPSQSERELAAAESRVIELKQRRRSEEISRLLQQQRADRVRRRQEVWAKLANRRRELWEATPDWARMTLVGVAAGLLVCLPLFFLRPSPYIPDAYHEASKEELKAKDDEASKVSAEAESLADIALEEDKQIMAQKVRWQILAKDRPQPSPSKEGVDPQLRDILSLAQRREAEGDFEAAMISYRVILEEYATTKQAKDAAEKLRKWRMLLGKVAATKLPRGPRDEPASTSRLQPTQENSSKLLLGQRVSAVGESVDDNRAVIWRADGENWTTEEFFARGLNWPAVPAGTQLRVLSDTGRIEDP
jgi:hypothetical protein